jgi:hypothetical protein
MSCEPYIWTGHCCSKSWQLRLCGFPCGVSFCSTVSLDVRDVQWKDERFLYLHCASCMFLLLLAVCSVVCMSLHFIIACIWFWDAWLSWLWKMQQRNVVSGANWRWQTHEGLMPRGCKSWGFHSGGYEECRLLGYNPVRTSQETHYVSTAESSQLMLCKIWCFHGDDYEECHLLGYNNPVHTSQETNYISATDSSQLMLCKIWGFHGGDYEECCLLGCKTMTHLSCILVCCFLSHTDKRFFAACFSC